MKSDQTTLAAGFAAVLGFNLRQLKRYAIGKVYPKCHSSVEINYQAGKILANTSENIYFPYLVG